MSQRLGNRPVSHRAPHLLPLTSADVSRVSTATPTLLRKTARADAMVTELRRWGRFRHRDLPCVERVDVALGIEAYSDAVAVLN